MLKVHLPMVWSTSGRYCNLMMTNMFINFVPQSDKLCWATMGHVFCCEVAWFVRQHQDAIQQSFEKAWLTDSLICLWLFSWNSPKLHKRKMRKVETWARASHQYLTLNSEIYKRGIMWPNTWKEMLWLIGDVGPFRINFNEYLWICKKSVVSSSVQGNKKLWRHVASHQNTASIL